MGDVATIADLGNILQKLLGYALGLAGIVLFILLIVGGFQFITSGGDPKAAEGAKKTITSAIIGLIVILVSFIILVIIRNITGVDVTQFNLMFSP